MFDQEDYESDDGENVMQSHKEMADKKVLVPSSSSDFNHLTGEGESLLKIMKERGFDIAEPEAKKISLNSSHEKQVAKPKQKTGYFDGGSSATLEQLMKALNKAFSIADPQQASCILSYILEKKNLSLEDRNKFGLLKCKLLFGLGAYSDCANKAEELRQKPLNMLSEAILSNYLAKCKAELNDVLSGYMDLLRAHAIIGKCREAAESQKPNEEKLLNDFAQSQLETFVREIDHTELEYNIKMAKYKNATNLVHPYFMEFRHRNVVVVACGDHHALFLIGAPIDAAQERVDYEVFGVGENSLGQITGAANQKEFKTPVLIAELSGKGIEGICAVKQSSLAYDKEGNIYEWGMKQIRNQSIEVTYRIGEGVLKLDKGYRHYAVLTKTRKFLTWGNIYYQNVSIYKQLIPQTQPVQNVASFSCGHSCVVAVDDWGELFSLGNNEFGQLALEGELHSKAFKKCSSQSIGKVKTVNCLQDTTFILTQENEIYICGRISQNKTLERLKEAEFAGDVGEIVSISGILGKYWVVNGVGQAYKWEVDTSVKFKPDKENDKIPQRFTKCYRGLSFRVQSIVRPELTKTRLMTEEPKSYEPINFQMELYDNLGPYGNSFCIPLRCQVIFSTCAISTADLRKDNELFLENSEVASGRDIILTEIRQSRLLSCQLNRNVRPYLLDLSLASEESGLFHIYVFLEKALVGSYQIKISVSEREKQLSQKAKLERSLREEERKRKTEIERERILQDKLRKQAEEEERQKNTQKRAEQALRKHMKEQEDQRARNQQDRKARKDLLTGGGFDLNKLKARNQIKAEVLEKTSQMMKSTESFLPNINMRPNSRRKINIPARDTGPTNSMLREKSNKALEEVVAKVESEKESKEQKSVPVAVSQIGTKPGTSGAKILVKRGLSKSRKPQ